MAALTSSLTFWQCDQSGRELPESDGISAELGLYDDLATCLHPGESWIEYGIVEHRYSEAFPDVDAQLLERYGHTRIAHKPFTTSSFLSLALGRLVERGDLAKLWGPATGYWAYNGAIFYYSLVPSPPDDQQLCFADFASGIGLDPKQ